MNASIAQLVEHSSGMLKVPGSNTCNRKIVSLKFRLIRKRGKWKRTTTSIRVIPWSLADGRRQKHLLGSPKLQVTKISHGTW